MKNLVEIDGAPGANINAVARLVAGQLGWPLVSEASDASNTPALIEGAGVSRHDGLEPRWRFYLAAAPGELTVNPAAMTGGDARPQGTSARLDAETILIDTTGFAPDLVAAMIAALVSEDLE